MQHLVCQRIEQQFNNEDHQNDGNILREENEREMWDYLQNYAFLGLQQIEIWLNDPGNASIEPKDIILDEMKKIAVREGLHELG